MQTDRPRRLTDNTSADLKSGPDLLLIAEKDIRRIGKVGENERPRAHFVAVKFTVKAEVHGAEAAIIMHVCVTSSNSRKNNSVRMHPIIEVERMMRAESGAFWRLK